ncbi:unnamed protein product, partial [Urochloa humidicola]
KTTAPGPPPDPAPPPLRLLAPHRVTWSPPTAGGRSPPPVGRAPSPPPRIRGAPAAGPPAAAAVPCSARGRLGFQRQRPARIAVPAAGKDSPSATGARARLPFSLPWQRPTVPSSSSLRMADKADWSDANVKHLIDACKGEIEAKNRPLGTFTRTGWTNLIAKIEEKTDQKLTKKQLKNKLDNMKKEYTWFMEFKNAATGLGWNEAKETMDCSKEWWDEHLARCNDPVKGTKCNHVRFRKRGPKHLDDLHLLFDKTHVTGASASCPDDISSSDSSDEDAAGAQKIADDDDVKLAALKKSKQGKKKHKDSSTATEEKDEKSPFFRLYKNTCSKLESAAERISTSVEASSVPPTNQVPTIKEAMQMVKDCGVQEKTALMRTATFLIVKPDFREVFSLLETKEGMFDLLEREHEKELMKRL